MDKQLAVPSSTDSAIAALPGIQADLGLKAERVQEPLAAEAVGQPVSVGPGWEVRLKAERVQNPTALLAEDAAAEASEVAVTLELALNHPQPMTIELIQPRIVITFAGQSG